MQHNNWYVITGGPSTGKTTLLAELAKLGYKTIPEAARQLIDEAVAKGVEVTEFRADEKRFQEDVARLKERIEATIDADTITFFDRGMHDTIAYLKYYGFAIEQWVEALMRKSTYRTVFLLDPLPTYRADYARTEDADFTLRLHDMLSDAYTKFSLAPVRVPALSLAERTAFVLEHVKNGAPV